MHPPGSLKWVCRAKGLTLAPEMDCTGQLQVGGGAAHRSSGEQRIDIAPCVGGHLARAKFHLRAQSQIPADEQQGAGQRV